MSIAYLAQPEQQRQLEWLDGGTLAMLLDGTALVWFDGEEMELSEGGIVFLPRMIPHAYRITSKKADLLMINTPAGIEGLFRHAGRDRSTPRPDGFETSPDLLAEASQMYGSTIVGPPR